MRKILITNYFLRTYTGSELVAFDLAKKFRDLGWKVILITRYFEEPLKSLIEKENIQVYLSDSSELENLEIDLLWIQHFPLMLDVLTAGVKAKKIIYSSLSHLEGVESPPFFIEEMNMFCFQSIENLEKRDPTKFAHQDRCFIFENFVPDEFIVYGESSLYKKSCFLRKILCVSNHFPDFVRDSFALLKERGIEVKRIGGDDFELVTPELLSNYDAIMTIGRTVQMGLCIGIPVFCYDHFGGPGYINNINKEKALKFNFSGRCCNRILTPQELTQELIDEYPKALNEVEVLKSWAKEYFSLDKTLSKVFDILENTPNFRWNSKDCEKLLYINQVSRHEKMLEEMCQRQQDLKKIKLMELSLSDVTQRLKKVECEKDQLRKNIDVLQEKNSIHINELDDFLKIIIRNKKKKKFYKNIIFILLGCLVSLLLVLWILW